MSCEDEGTPKAEIEMMRANGMDPEEVVKRNFEEAYDVSSELMKVLSAFEIRTQDAVKFASSAIFGTSRRSTDAGSTTKRSILSAQ